MDELKRYSPLLGLICMLFFAGGCKDSQIGHLTERKQ